LASFVPVADVSGYVAFDVRMFLRPVDEFDGLIITILFDPAGENFRL